MKNQAFRMALLFDFYGDVLTDRQKEFYDLYYNEDLSLAEIAEQMGITRQGVRECIKKAEAELFFYEERLGLRRRLREAQKHAETALEACHRAGEIGASVPPAVTQELEALASLLSE